MGIKNIHIALIACSTILALILGVWGFSHDFALLGGLSLAASVGLLLYGISFWKKAKTL